MNISSTPSPAAAFVQQNQWLKQGENTPFMDLVATGPDTVDVVVGDGWEPKDSDYYEEQSRTVADQAAHLLEPVVDGVKLLVRTESGYVGQPTYVSSPDEQYFAGGFPGVTSQFYTTPFDVNGDGTVGNDELAWEFSVDSPETAARIDKLVVDRTGYDRDEPIIYTVDA